MENVYEKKVFFIENLGFIKNTEARQISFDESLRFEQYHIDAYSKFGFELVKVPKSSVPERIQYILNDT